MFAAADNKHWHSARQQCQAGTDAGATGLVMVWEGGGNACVDGMLTIQTAEKPASHVYHHLYLAPTAPKVWLVDDVPEADAIISGGSIENNPSAAVKRQGRRHLPANNKANFPARRRELTMDTTTHLYLGGTRRAPTAKFSRGILNIKIKANRIKGGTTIEEENAQYFQEGRQVVHHRH